MGIFDGILAGIETFKRELKFALEDECGHLYLKDGVCVDCGRTEAQCIRDLQDRRGKPAKVDQRSLRNVTILGGKVRREHNPTAREKDAENPWRPEPEFPDDGKMPPDQVSNSPVPTPDVLRNKK